MVLQREKPIAIWGLATPQAQVTVDFAGQSQVAAAGADGSWQVKLDPLPASSEPRELRVTSANENITLSDVLVGEVWLLGGQSNMEMPLWWRCDSDGMQSAKDTRLVIGTNHPWLRVMTVPQRASATLQDDFSQGEMDGDGVATGRWFVAEEKHPAISGFSALGYFMGVQLHEKLNVPIGLVDTSWGGTIASAWNSRESLAAIPEAAKMLERKEAAAAAWTPQGAKEELEANLVKWQALVEAAKRENRPPPGRPEFKPDPASDRNFPAGPFNAMIWPLRKMSLRGVFFYQGENNYFDDEDPFAKTFPGVTNSWREAFGSHELPFCIFQICGWENTDILYLQTKLPILQEQQHQAHLSLPHTGLVITMDYPHVDIHPMVKRVIAERALRWARAEVYGEIGLTWGSPTLDSSVRNGAEMKLNFRTFGNEAILLKGEPTGLVIAGKDGKFVEAKAKVVNRTSLLVWSEQVPEPVMVRYAWSQRAVCRLYSASGLPIGPFRTDKGEIPSSEISR
jgi:sialate O-acetylesterase